MNQKNNRFLISYLEKDVFAEQLEQIEKNPAYRIPQELYHYVKCIAPTHNEIFPMLARRFSDVEVTGIAQEEDFINAINVFNKNDLNDKAYIVKSTDSVGNSTLDVILDASEVPDAQIVSEVTIGEYTKHLQATLAYFSDEKIPTLSHTD